MKNGSTAWRLALIGMVLVVSMKPAMGKLVSVGDSKLNIELQIDSSGLSEKHYKVDGQVMDDLSGAPWSLKTDSGDIIPSTADQITSPANEAVFEGSTDSLDWRLSYQQIARGLITKSLTITPKREILIERVSMWNAKSSQSPAVSSTSLQDIAGFYRQGRRGLFVSLDFPYSKITNEDGITGVTYPPFIRLAPGKSYTCHTLTIGATTLTGRIRYGFDEGEADAMDNYIQERFKPRFERPMFVSASINNRYTMPQGDIIFYTMKDHPTLGFNTDLLKRDIELMPRLGMEYYQLWPGPFDSAPGDPDPDFVKSIVRFAGRKGVRVGDYSGTSSIFCVHYNEHRNTLDNHPEWGIKNSDICFGNPRFSRFYRDMVVENDRKYGFQIHCLDFLSIRECNSTEHGHPAGRDSIYSQVEGLVDVLQGLNDVSADMMTWSNSGNWAELLPKIAWWNSNLYLTDPFIASPWQGLNMTRLLDDARREQMVSLHYSRFIPYRFLTNCQYFFCQNSIVPDIRNYQYGVLSTIAVTPNLCLGEIRPWLDRLPEPKQAEVLSFYKKWTSFLTKNFNLWRKTYQVGENPGTGAVEIYGHAQDDHGFVFIVNPHYSGRTVDIPLDTSLGFTAEGKCEIAEIYPTQKLMLTNQGPFPAYGSAVTMYAPPQQVIVLEVKRAPAVINEPRLYGIPGSIVKDGEGYEVRTSGPQGHTERCAVVLPGGAKLVTSAEARTDMPRLPARLYSPTTIRPVASEGSGIAMDITFRRAAAPDELRDWQVRKASLSEGTSAGLINGFENTETLRFPLFADIEDPSVKMPLWDEEANKLNLGPLANFCGAYIDNAFSEEQETYIRLNTGGKSSFSSGHVATDTVHKKRSLPEQAKDKACEWWLQTKFHLPFMYTIGAEPFFDEHTILVLPFMRKSNITAIQAWINGVPLDVRSYAYPRNRALSCYYADLIGTSAAGGDNRLIIYIQSK